MFRFRRDGICRGSPPVALRYRTRSLELGVGRAAYGREAMIVARDSSFGRMAVAGTLDCPPNAKTA